MNTRAITQNKKVVTFGEVMLRLTAPKFQRFSQTNEFIATYGGSECSHITGQLRHPHRIRYQTSRECNGTSLRKLTPSLRIRYRRHYLWWETHGIILSGKRCSIS